MQNTQEAAAELFPIIEIFQSIQGEGVNAGQLAVFVRFAGCNLRCEWCDTKDSWDIPAALKVTRQQVLDRINSFSASLIIFTGGEPTLYMTQIASLVKDLKNKHADRTFAIETNGTMPVDREAIDWVSCSPKPPLYALKCKYDELKYVVDDQFSLGVIGPGARLSDKPIWLQVESGKKESVAKILKILNTSNRYRLGAQLHQLLNLK